MAVVMQPSGTSALAGSIVVERPSAGIDRSEADWYKDAIIYQLHVKAFNDSSNDGIGDFTGLMQCLDYVQELGVNTIWLLPFYPSPLRDDGYDIAEYCAVNERYGDLDGFVAFIEEAHQRGLRVITELVINHTSDQHPWFQRARQAPPDSTERNYYVWSDTAYRYMGTRIIFLDTETSNWTWDPVAKAYFWHRFYSHQPDLNFDNPEVFRQVVDVMRFWLDLGVDGLRLDAVPYLCEREGTNNENLPETHAILRRIRKEVDASYPDRMLLAEANQWPEDTRPYFGDGDECHMAFHFPLMPRLYMALAQEDRHPVTDILRQTPEIPQNCQWALFLRNHDELTLEMVTDDERDYLWRTYASDARSRINLGIRRRLAPLLDNDRRKIELMVALLLSMPGTPVIYYGDELGMGDNYYLGDRDGVRTPMQWSGDRNGGFSRADPQRLYLPPIMDPIYGFQAVNVESQQRDPSSLLNWMKRMMAVRNLHKAFGRGRLSFLYPRNRKVLAFILQHENQELLCVFNLARTAQAVELDLSTYRDAVPLELTGSSPFPSIGALPYMLTLPAYGFYWFALVPEGEEPHWRTTPVEPSEELVTLVMSDGWRSILEGRESEFLNQKGLPDFVTRQRWFGAKDRRIGPVSMRALGMLQSHDDTFPLTVLDVDIVNAASQRYFFPLASRFDSGSDYLAVLPFTVARLRRGSHTGLLLDAAQDEVFACTVVNAIHECRDIEATEGVVSFEASGDWLPIGANASVRSVGTEQSNVTLIADERIVLKLYRRLREGIQPEIEIARFLTEQTAFKSTPAYLGMGEYRPDDGVPSALVVLFAFVNNQGDCWNTIADALESALDEEAMWPGGQTAPTDEAKPPYSFPLDLPILIGRRTGEMHAAFAVDTDDADFAREPIVAEDISFWVAAVRRDCDCMFRAVNELGEVPHSATVELLRLLNDARNDIECRLDALAETSAAGMKTRIHGDYHLGQILVAHDDVCIIDFEGEPGRPFDERRAKTSPLRDVAGMLRSFDYAAHFALDRIAARSTELPERLLSHAHAWRKWADRAFLEAYWSTLEGTPGDIADRAAARAQLELFLIQKAIYEITYEIGNRPHWIAIPVQGLARTDRKASDGRNGIEMKASPKAAGEGRDWRPDKAEIDAIVSGSHGDAFAVLGPHATADGGVSVRVFAPEAEMVQLVAAEGDGVLCRLEKLHPDGLFASEPRKEAGLRRYRLRLARAGRSWDIEDAYRFPHYLGEMDVHLLAEGSHQKLYDKLGAHPLTLDGVDGVAFAVWAPHAQRVSVVGDFNSWDGRRHPMRRRLEAGVWEIFIPHVAAGALYKYEIIGPENTPLPLKADPVSFSQEAPPATASRVCAVHAELPAADDAWMQTRASAHERSAPISIYEVHLGSWRRGENNAFLDYDRLADELIAYVRDLGFTHVELLPVSEHPFTGSWGYQPIGLYAPSARFGPPEAFQRFVVRMHQAGIGVIVDWVPAHFPSDAHGLVRFDGTALYEHEDPRLGFHHDWNTLIYNFGRREVANFLEANALFWFDRYRVDGLRVDAVASMLYLDYSRDAGKWVPNMYGGRENLEAVAFLRNLNTRVYEAFPDVMTIAEESTAWPQVSRPVDGGGLGFGYKWNMGWMHDTLTFMSQDPVHRRFHYGQMTFGLVYAFAENFVLPLSHDEVVHGKGSLLAKMPGDRWQKFANLRAYLGFMWTHPGKKLLFMGGEFGQEREWNHDRALDWHLLAERDHRGVQSLVRDLNKLYRDLTVLHERDCETAGFEWVVADDSDQSVLAFLRHGSKKGDTALIVCNFTPVVRHCYKCGVPHAGRWRERLNSDAAQYGGSNVGNGASIRAAAAPSHGQPASLELTLPPLATIVLTPGEQ